MHYAKIELKIYKYIFHLHDSRRSFFHNIKNNTGNFEML